eukprot:TRINITY_DN3070_c0_g1_i2.p1 TRINITY_DN3070_c0_g1~~TRINITY_DN3070_c0_g1_i2.p1  ORF type:complete len:848 (+),score=147.50 TRINITY_DN3070_c0_g1_i2:58-2601(+)
MSKRAFEDTSDEDSCEPSPIRTTEHLKIAKLIERVRLQDALGGHQHSTAREPRKRRTDRRQFFVLGSVFDPTDCCDEKMVSLSAAIAEQCGIKCQLARPADVMKYDLQLVVYSYGEQIIQSSPMLTTSHYGNRNSPVKVRVFKYIVQGFVYFESIFETTSMDVELEAQKRCIEAARQLACQLGSTNPIRYHLTALQHAIEKQRNRAPVIVAYGETRSGKSRLLNTLMGIEVVPTPSRGEAGTLCPIKLQYSVGWTAKVMWLDGSNMHRHVREALMAVKQYRAMQAQTEDVPSIVQRSMVMLRVLYGDDWEQVCFSDSDSDFPPLTIRLMDQHVDVWSTSVNQSSLVLPAVSLIDIKACVNTVMEKLWPLIDHITISGPMECCQHCTFIDVPGCADGNLLRMSLLQRFMTKVLSQENTKVWFVAPARRCAVESVIDSMSILNGRLLEDSNSRRPFTVEMIITHFDELLQNVQDDPHSDEALGALHKCVGDSVNYNHLAWLAQANHRTTLRKAIAQTYPSVASRIPITFVDALDYFRFSLPRGRTRFQDRRSTGFLDVIGRYSIHVFEYLNRTHQFVDEQRRKVLDEAAEAHILPTVAPVAKSTLIRPLVEFSSSVQEHFVFADVLDTGVLNVADHWDMAGVADQTVAAALRRQGEFVGSKASGTRVNLNAVCAQAWLDAVRSAALTATVHACLNEVQMIVENSKAYKSAAAKLSCLGEVKQLVRDACDTVKAQFFERVQATIPQCATVSMIEAVKQCLGPLYSSMNNKRMVQARASLLLPAVLSRFVAAECAQLRQEFVEQVQQQFGPNGIVAEKVSEALGVDESLKKAIAAKSEEKVHNQICCALRL